MLTVSVMLVVGTFLLQNISAYYYNDFSNSLNNQVFTDNFVSDLEEAASGSDALYKLPELLDIYSSRIGIDSFRNYYNGNRWYIIHGLCFVLQGKAHKSQGNVFRMDSAVFNCQDTKRRRTACGKRNTAGIKEQNARNRVRKLFVRVPEKDKISTFGIGGKFGRPLFDASCVSVA